MDNLFASFDYKPFPNPPSDSRCVLTRAAAAATRTQQIRRFEHCYKQIEERHAEPVYLTSALDPSLSATVTFIKKKIVYALKHVLFTYNFVYSPRQIL